MSINTEIQRLKNAKSSIKTSIENKGVEVGDTVLLDDYSELIDQIETGGGSGWKRPDDWWDTENIIKNAEPIEYGSGMCYPAYIVLLDDSNDTTTFPKSTVDVALYVTSDGSRITMESTVHTWDKTKDKDCSLGYKTRYYIVYLTEAHKNAYNKSINLQSQTDVLEIFLYDITFTGDNMLFAASSSGNRYIENIKGGENCKLYKLGEFNYCTSLKNIEFPHVTSMSGSFYYCRNLRSIKLPSLVEISSSSFCSDCSSLSLVDFSSVTSITGSNTFYNCYNLQEVNFPKIETISSGSLFNESGVKKINFPKLKNITSNYTFYGMYNLTELNLPTSLTNIGNYNYVVGCIYNLRSITIPNGLNVGCLNLTDSIKMTHDSLVNLMNALGTVSSSTRLYLGSTNLAKLTNEEKAIATNKGWSLY